MSSIDFNGYPNMITIGTTLCNITFSQDYMYCKITEILLTEQQIRLLNHEYFRNYLILLEVNPIFFRYIFGTKTQNKNEPWEYLLP